MSLVIGTNKTFVGETRRLVNFISTGYKITGVATKAGQPFSYGRIWLINRRTGLLVNATTTNAAGVYEFLSVPLLDGDTEGYIVLGFDDQQLYDPEAKDFIQPEAG